MATGTVKWFNTTKGYGFITPDEGGSDAFVHITAVQRSGLQGLNEGQKVEFELVEQRNGKMAAEEHNAIESFSDCWSKNKNAPDFEGVFFRLDFRNLL